jgi:outer membrane protein assembly complex protein YaeT
MTARGCFRLVAPLALALTASGCFDSGDPGDISVLALTFDGNRALTDSELAAVLATKAGGSLPWSRKRYFDRAEFAEDLKRLERAYADRGYPQARVAKADVQFNAKHDGVKIAVRMTEGDPVIVDRVDYAGFDVLGPSGEKALGALPLKAGMPRDRRLASTTRDEAQRLLHDQGYPYATVTIAEAPAQQARHVNVTVTAQPGPLAHFGPVTVVGNTTVQDSVIRRALTFAPGELYREREVQRSQRRLSGLQLFQLANIDTHPQEPGQPAQVPVKVTVAEGPHQRATFRVGFGSEEKLRVSTEWSHLNFLGGAKTATVQAKWSSLERGARLSFGQPAFFWQTSLSVNGDAWWAHEPAYTSRTTGGRVKITRPLGGHVDRPRVLTQTISLSYVNEFLSYQIADSAAGIPHSREQLIALGLDPDTGKGQGTLSSLEVDFERRALNTATDPTRGYAALLHLAHASPALGGSFRYDAFMAEGRGYRPLGSVTSGRVWASRVRVGAIFAADPAAVPFSERYFLGGSTSLRGWGRYQVGPLDSTGQAVGGRALFEFSNELRFAFTDKFGGVIFLDAGNVWESEAAALANLARLRYDVGPGLRYKTPIGSLRADFGYQLNPIPGLTSNGTPVTRRWRISFSVGQAF